VLVTKKNVQIRERGKLPNVNHHIKTLRIAVVCVVECILKEVVTTGFYVTHVIHGFIGIVQDWTMTNYGIIIPKQIDITTVLFVKQVIETIEQSYDYNYWGTWLHSFTCMKLFNTSKKCLYLPSKKYGKHQ
jgi:hypothetical protein